MKNKNGLKALLLIFAILFSNCNPIPEEPEFRGKVVGIADGDTFTLLSRDKKQTQVRLSEIDTPESNQPYGTRAKQALSDLIFSKDVRVLPEDVDRFGRLVGHVYVDGIHVNRKMVQEGNAWVYRQYNKDKTLLQDEQAARDAKKGFMEPSCF